MVGSGESLSAGPHPGGNREPDSTRFEIPRAMEPAGSEPPETLQREESAAGHQPRSVQRAERECRAQRNAGLRAESRNPHVDSPAATVSGFRECEILNVTSQRSQSQQNAQT